MNTDKPKPERKLISDIHRVCHVAHTVKDGEVFATWGPTWYVRRGEYIVGPFDTEEQAKKAE